MLKFVHFTDCHLGNTADVIYKNYNTYDSLRGICQQIKALENQLDFILVTGDISQTGDRPSYTLFETIVEQFAIPVYCIPGNHDDPQLLREFFPDSPVEHISALQLNEVFLFLINTTVAGKEYGDIQPHVQNELESLLSQNPGKPAIIAMHHPLMETGTRWMDEIAIQAPENFRQYCLNHKNIKLVLNGHAHMDMEIERDNTRFITTPSTCYQFKPFTDDKVVYDTQCPGYRIISITEGFNIASSLYRTNC